MIILRLFGLILPLVAALALPAAADNPFAPVARVNEQVVTGYELQQRARFMTLLRAPGDPQKEALKALIDERLQSAVARTAGITLSPEQIKTGMEEFAARAKLSADEFIKALAQAGVDAETFRDFVKAGLSWREVVRSKFASRTQITEVEIDRAIAQSSKKNGLKVLLSEIILPAHTPAAKAQSEKRAQRISKIKSFAGFSAQARKYSASGSRGRGGRLNWMPLSNLPPQLRGQVMALSVGQVSPPIPIPNGIVLFQMRGIEETGIEQPKDVSLEYASYLIPGGRSASALKQAEKIKGKVDVCDDLYGVAKGQPEEVLQITTLPMDQIPGDIALELAKLDPGEVSTRLTRANGQTLLFLMLCGRTAELGEDVSREAIRERLVNARLQSYADSYLADLRADATITYP
ncbi:MAG: peptidylprolyl isomerase [Rhodobacterales bacterium]|nr:MAG: peptidylprolyl isomerase [Rhodobacterales bacterium]